MELNTPEELEWLNEFHPPDEIAQRLSVATAFVRLTMDLECEVLDGKTSAAAVIFFLNENIDRVRAAYRTMAEYSISRASQPEAKEVWEARMEDAEETVRDLLNGEER